jgi:NAD(P)H-hydrate epimerase
VATHPVHAHWLNLARPELMCRAVASPGDLNPVLERATVLAVGPGLGQDGWARDLLHHALATGKPTVIDADALVLLDSAGIVAGQWVLTPHPGEAAQLLDCSTATVQGNRFKAARDIAEKYQAVTVLKGCGSLIAEPLGGWALCPLGNPGMASGGSGDALTGVIAALLAQGLNSWDAACVGVLAHAMAGDLAAHRGQRGLLAGDTIDALRQILND